MGPCTASSCCLPGPECVMGPCTPIPLLLSPSHTLLAIKPLSGLLLTLLVYRFHFFQDRVLYGAPIAAASTATPHVAPHSGLAP
ncbi:unnamed protein product [Staurois parvus]|uniref:Uncharacterized protein n=1 Tax=Staurois parvus TaxID=386267 RepID=A0ABN9CWZ7_9NEOB|nr:unnamed protein product [Staurois parvus]